jgi:hypothetical protein
MTDDELELAIDDLDTHIARLEEIIATLDYYKAVYHDLLGLTSLFEESKDRVAEYTRQRNILIDEFNEGTNPKGKR